MIADSTEIKFQCSQCGQSISVDSSAVGLSANCPTCDNPLVVPSLSSLHHRQYGELSETGHERPAYAAEEPDFSAAEMQELREDLIAAQRRADDAERAVAAARKEAVRLQQQLTLETEHGEGHAASAISAQGDVERLQVEREQLNGELAQSRQQAAIVESQLGDARAKIAQLAAGLEVAEENRAQWVAAFDQTSENAQANETQLAAREAELNEALAGLGESAHALAAARTETDTLQSERAILSQQIESAQAGLRDANARGATLEEKLAATQRTLESTEAERQTLSVRCEALRQEEKILRRDLSESHDGRELLTLRERLRTLESDHQKATASLGRREAEVQSLTTAVLQVRADLIEARDRGADAERRAEAASESQIAKDNEVLRGIIARQNTAGEERFVELRRLKRARLMLRLVYGLFGLGILGLLALGFHILPDALKQLLGEWFGF